MKTTFSSHRRYITTILLAATLVAGGFVGCGKQSTPAKSDTTPTSSQPTAMESILAAWEQGDQATAISRFLETDWSARPLCAPGSTMALSEDQFKKLPEAERTAKSAEVQTQLASLRKLVGAVAQAGRDAAARKDVPGARRHFDAIQQLGQAMDTPDSMLIVNLVGKALQKMAAAEIAKLPQS